VRTAYKILIIGFILRLIPFVYVSFYNPDGLLGYDSYGYWNIADNLIEHQVFSQAVPGQDLVPDIFRTPTFPILLLVIKFFANSVYWVSFVLLLFGSISVLLTYRLASLFTDNLKVVALSAFLVAIDIPSIFFSSIVLTETVFTTLLLWILYLFFKQEMNMKRALLIGLLLSVLVLCRPIALYLPLLFVVYLIRNKVGLKPLLSFVFASYFLIGAWMYRNYAHFDMFSLTTVGTTNLYFQSSAALLVDAEDLSPQQASDKLWSDLHAEKDWQHTAEEVKPMAHFFREKSWEYISKYPLTFTKHCGIGVIYFFYKPIRGYIDNYLGFNNSYNPVSKKNVSTEALKVLKDQTSLLAIILVVVQLVLMFFMTSGIAVGLLKPAWKKEVFFLLFVVGYFAILSAFSEVDGRFRIPVIPLIAIVSTYGWSKVLKARFEPQ
jgi:hypothetical protein